jgi:Flp pilus assembly protein TadD
MRKRLTRSRQTAEQPAGGAALTSAEPAEEPAELEEPAPAELLPEPPSGASVEAIVDHWREVVLRNPASAEARRRLARTLESRGEATLAVEQLEAARAQEPENVDLIVELAQAQTALRRFDAAERELRRALKLQPDSSAVYLSLGVISLRRGLYTQAEQELRRATDLDPESGTALYYRSEALNQLSRVDEALDTLSRAAQLQPNDPRSYYLMGILYDKKAQPSQAGAMYRKAREVGGA